MTDGAERLCTTAFDEAHPEMVLPYGPTILGPSARVEAADSSAHGAVVAVDGRVVARREVLVAVPTGRSRSEGTPISLREICHDLRQPIATIQALAEAALCHRELPDVVQSRLRHILGEARVLADLAHRLTADALVLMPISSAAILAEVVDEASVTFAGVIQCEAVLGPTLLADPVALRRALCNVVDNATRAAGPDGAVTASLVREEAAIAFEISDSGPGFGLAPPGVATLGLGIAERIVRAHGGRIEVGHGAMGGALVRLVLPILAEQAVRATEAAS